MLCCIGYVNMCGCNGHIWWYVSYNKPIYSLVRFKKQRKYSPDNSIVVKFLPCDFALVVATVILKIKPVEAQFCKTLYNSCRETARAFLYTIQGIPVQPERMTKMLSETFAEYGFHICVSDLRHALDAFAHKMAKSDAGWDPVLSTMANHNLKTSAGYGRDQNTLSGIPADISESNAIR